MNSKSDFSSFVRLNVGGKKLCTHISTLTKRDPNSKLAAMFSTGDHSLCIDEKGYVYIDRDGKSFTYILNWLRDGSVPTLEDSKYSQLLKEAEYFQLEELVSCIHLLQMNKKEKELGTELTRRDIIKYILDKEHYSPEPKFRGVNLSGIDLSGLELTGINFSYACMKNTCFAKANLSNSNFDHIDAEGADFDNSHIADSSFETANLKGANFSYANLGRAFFRMANLQGSTFYKAKLGSSILDGTNLQGANFNYANLGSSQFREADLEGASAVGIEYDEGTIPFSGYVSPYIH
ncbi:FH protein interacting protein FIP2-like [Argentina anserina]|uniref:FH protein interacting protein FIP2-like n=1 Tax=Argentina anserina TaxID=57926 RepID=UPI002176925E|nr:FH protein interacting protein FIP2-like [Potentilla anserina]